MQTIKRLAYLCCGLMLLGIAVSGCKGSKAAGKADPKTTKPVKGDVALAAPIIGLTKVNNLEFKTLSVKGKFDYQGTSNIKASYKMNMEYGKKVWVSFSMLGIEGVRLLATPDSVFFMNKLEKLYFVSDYASLEKRVGFPISFVMLQDMFIGNLSADSNNLNLTATGSGLYVYKETTSSALQTEYTISADKKKLMGFALTHSGSGTTAKLVYDSFSQVASKSVPHHLNLVSNSSFLKNLDLKHDGIEVNPSAPSFSFTIPNNYSPMKF